MRRVIIHLLAVIITGAINLAPTHAEAARFCVSGFDSAKTVQVRVQDLTSSTTLQAWTSTGVTESTNGQGKSTYCHAATTPTDCHDLLIDWQDNSTPIRTAAEAVTGYNCTGKELRNGNVRQTFVLATADNATRKVKTGRIDYTLYETKADAAADWSAPTSSKRLYFWYTKMGDVNPFKIGENN